MKKNIWLSPLVGISFFAAIFTTPVYAMEDNDIFNATRVELGTGWTDRGESTQSLRAKGWIGSDYHRFAWKVEADRENGTLEEADLQALYAHYLAPFWELQMGVRQQQPDSDTYAVIGLQGLAPYAFDVDLAMFVRTDGKLFARTDVEYDLLWTNRLIFRPYIKADWSVTRIESENVRRGLQDIEAGVNVRYEFTRAIAPYVELARSERRAIGSSHAANIVRVGLKLLF